MIAKCEGYDADGRQVELGIDEFHKYIIYRNLLVEEIEDTLDAVFFSSGRADDKVFNLIYFEDKEENIIATIQTSAVVYLMDKDGKTFEIVRIKK